MAAPDIYISVRFSEARDKAQLLDESLRKRGINAVMADPQSRWDRHADISGKVKRLLVAADLVVVIVTPLYGKKLRSHFGSHEEIELIKYFQKPTFIVQACEETTMSSVLDLGESEFDWGLGEPGEPPLPGGVIDLIADKLSLVRGIVPEDEMSFQTQGTSIDGQETDRLDGRGRAAIAKAAREKEEASVRAARMSQEAKSGNTNILKVCPDAMTIRGATSLINSLTHGDKTPAQAEARAESLAWFREAAEACDYRDAKLFLAGCLYEDKDHDGAVKWLQEAMEGEKAEKLITKKKNKEKKKKKNRKGNKNEDDEEDGEDGGKQEEWKGIGGEAHLECLTNLGECYYHGEGVKRDRPEAAKLYRKAAEQGYPPAQANLAEMLSTGEGVIKDLVEAAQWFGAAASAGLMEAQFGLGHAYERGEGVEKNLAMAAFWYETAASQGHMHATGALDHLEAKMQAKIKGV